MLMNVGCIMRKKWLVCFLLVTLMIICLPGNVIADSPIDFGEIDFNDSTLYDQ